MFRVTSPATFFLVSPGLFFMVFIYFYRQKKEKGTSEFRVDDNYLYCLTVLRRSDVRAGCPQSQPMSYLAAQENS